MKIIAISNYPLGSIKPEVMQMTRMLEALGLQGCQVEMYVPVGDIKSWHEIENIYGKFLVWFPIREIRDIGIPGPITKPRSFLTKVAYHAWNLLRSLLIAIQIKDCDGVILTQNVYLAWLQAKLNKQVVFELMSLPSRGQLPLIRQMSHLRTVQCIVSISRGLTEDLVQMMGFRPNKLVVLPMGVDLDKLTISIHKEVARESLGLPKDRPVVVYTGATLRLDRGLDAVVRIAKVMQHVLFVVVGGRRDEIEELVKNIKIAGINNVLLVGYVPHSRVVLYHKAADVLLLLGSPNDRHQSRHASYAKMFEYMASGRPIVAHDLPAVREVLCNEVNALLVTPGEDEELITAINRLLTDSPLADKIARKAKEDVGRYTWQQRANNLLACIREKGY